MFLKKNSSESTVKNVVTLNAYTGKSYGFKNDLFKPLDKLTYNTSNFITSYVNNKDIITTTATLSLLLVALVGSSPLQASDVKYNYIEGRYILDAEADSNIDGDGVRMGGSFRFDQSIYAFGSFQSLDLDFGNDIDILELGAGYIYPLNANWDANFTAAFVNSEVNNDDDSGYSLTAGIRGMMTPKIEGRAKLTYIDVNDDDTFITLGADYFFLPNLSVGLEMDLSGDLETTSIGARYYF